MFPPRSGGWSGHHVVRRAIGRVSPPLGGMVRFCPSADRRFRCFPPARGDGPACCHVSGGDVEFPPRSGGWSGDAFPLQANRQVSPPLGGMVRASTASANAANGFPPARGDGPVSDALPGLVEMFPPRSGGWSGHARGALPVTAVSPPLGGMVRSRAAPLRCRGSFPPARGDGPCPPSSMSAPHRFPPRSGGWSVSFPPCLISGVVSPPLGGMVRVMISPAPMARRFPPARGDGPCWCTPRCPRRLFPPRSGGWSGVRRLLCSAWPVSPPLGGMVRTSSTSRRRPSRFPPARGDGPGKDLDVTGHVTFPPRSGGWSV